ncbi:hypothetical protein JCM9140_1600 [Halalkalibacter wakoensis JCM 9140]|uniref:Uncharacterized protein n=1 Tax=Halalkalibacter wakoensis JCM 9140 TaxID=1236970 RepID=W4Q0U1_9BACI|nr:hypothetical protein [Halalkalibacter wakoensis]GAE25597.1 hypothetical protein JCM9140_1600 [Halalkalibacter wakoensis JCM 9140]
MMEEHLVTIVDFQTTEHRTTFVKLVGYDAESNNKFEGEVKFVGGRPFGDLIHADRSALSASCREYVQTLLIVKYNEGEFK